MLCLVTAIDIKFMYRFNGCVVAAMTANNVLEKCKLVCA